MIWRIAALLVGLFVGVFVGTVLAIRSIYWQEPTDG